jgi:ABC-type amino acid transport system permease subunit
MAVESGCRQLRSLTWRRPGLVNNIVDLFKDTTLVTIIGLFDLLGAVNQALKDPAWFGFAKEGYVFSMVVFFACCFAISSYGRRFERRLNRHGADLNSSPRIWQEKPRR